MGASTRGGMDGDADLDDVWDVVDAAVAAQPRKRSSVETCALARARKARRKAQQVSGEQAESLHLAVNASLPLRSKVFLARDARGRLRISVRERLRDRGGRQSRHVFNGATRATEVCKRALVVVVGKGRGRKSFSSEQAAQLACCNKAQSIAALADKWQCARVTVHRTLTTVAHVVMQTQWQATNHLMELINQRGSPDFLSSFCMWGETEQQLCIANSAACRLAKLLS